MKASIPKTVRPIPTRRPIPKCPASLHGSFNSGSLSVDPKAVIEDLLMRVSLTEDRVQKLMQAQRVIGALMGFTAINVGGCGFVLYHREVFARLADLTGETPEHLVVLAGVAR